MAIDEPARSGMGSLRFESAAVDVYARVLHAFDQDDVAANEAPTDGYTRLEEYLNELIEKAEAKK